MKLTKPEIKLQEQVGSLLWTTENLTHENKEFIYSNFHPGTLSDITKDSAYFTPLDMAYDFALFAGRYGVVVDMCAGIGGLTFAAKTRDYYQQKIKHSICIERNPKFITIGKKLLPDSEWIEGDIFDKIINNFPDCIVVADADNGTDLIKRISLLETSPDVCILDIEMPVRNGYDTLVELKKTYPQMKFLVLTIFSSDFSIIKMIKNGANGYVLKNIAPEELNKAILSVYHDGYHYSKIASYKVFKMVEREKILDLTEKELNFIRLSCSDLSYAAIGKLMNISARSVEYYHQNVCQKFNFHCRMELALFAIQSGLVPVNQKENSKNT